MGMASTSFWGVEMRRLGAYLALAFSLLSTQDIAIFPYLSPALITSLLLPLPLQPLDYQQTPCLFRSET